jgi:transposase-like protein
MTKVKDNEVDQYKGLRGRSHWKRADAARVLCDWRRSGESMAAFARRHGLGAHRLHWWRDRVEDAVEEASVRLVPAVVRPAPLLTLRPASPQEAVVVEVDGIRVSISDPQETDPRWVAAVVSALRGEKP